MTATLAKRFFYLFLLSLFSFLAYLFIPYQHEWVLFSAFTLSLFAAGNTFGQRMYFIVGTGLAVALSIIIINCIVLMPPLLACYYFILGFFGVFLIRSNGMYRIPVFSVLLLSIAASSALLTLPLLNLRVSSILIGSGLVVVCQLLYWPDFFRHKLNALILLSWHQLDLLNKDCFACFLESTYSENIYLFERRIHIQKNRSLQAMIQLHQAVSAAQEKKDPLSEPFNILLTQTEYLFDLILDCAQLRRRLKDQSIFTICRNELSILVDTMHAQLKEIALSLRQGRQINQGPHLVDAIAQYENINYTVLRISAQDPLSFLLFINSLKAIQKTFQQMKCVASTINMKARNNE